MRLAEGVVLFDLVAVVFTDQVGDAELRAFIIVEEEDAVALEGTSTTGMGMRLAVRGVAGAARAPEIAEGGGADVFLTGGGGGQRQACEPECRSGGSGADAARGARREQTLGESSQSLPPVFPVRRRAKCIFCCLWATEGEGLSDEDSRSGDGRQPRRSQVRRRFRAIGRT